MTKILEKAMPTTPHSAPREALRRVRRLIAHAKDTKNERVFVDRLAQLGAHVVLHEDKLFGSITKPKRIGGRL